MKSIERSPPRRVRQVARRRRRRLAGGHHELDAEAREHAFEAVHLGGVVEVEQAAGFGIGDAEPAGEAGLGEPGRAHLLVERVHGPVFLHPKNQVSSMVLKWLHALQSLTRVFSAFSHDAHPRRQLKVILTK